MASAYMGCRIPSNQTMVHNLSRLNLENIVNSIVYYIRRLLPTERLRDKSFTIETTTDCSGSKHTLGSRIKEKSHCLQKHSHSTTGRSPADLLFNQKVKGKIPDLNVDHAYDLEVHDGDTERKAKSKVLCRMHIARGQSLQHRTG